jgi:hypothetical protein
MALHNLRRLLVAAMLTIVASVGPWNGSALAVPLSALLGGESIDAGDKTFSAWSLLGGSLPTTALSSIDVQALAVPSGNPGLRFVAANDVLTARNGEQVDLGFQFSVTAPAALIRGASLELTRFERSGPASMSIFEDLYTSAALVDLVDLNVVFADAGGDQLLDQASFDARSLLVVQTTIAIASGEDGLARLLQFEERFAQQPSQVSAPGVLPLFALGLAILAARRGRPRST